MMSSCSPRENVELGDSAPVNGRAGSRFTIISAWSRYWRIVRLNTSPVIFLCAYLMEGSQMLVLRLVLHHCYCCLMHLLLPHCSNEISSALVATAQSFRSIM